MKRVIDIFEHFRRADRRADRRRFDSFVYGLDHVAASFVKFANDDLTRAVVVSDGGAFAKEFRIHTDTEIFTGALAGGLFK